MNLDVVKFHIDDKVFFVLDGGKSGMVTGILFEKIGITYRVTWDDFNTRWHSESELTLEKIFKNKE